MAPTNMWHAGAGVGGGAGMKRSMQAVALAVALAIALAACGETFATKARFRLTIEDLDGKVLGSAVWEQRSWNDFPVSQARLVGEAFPIQLPDSGGLAFVLPVTAGCRYEGWIGGILRMLERSYRRAGAIRERRSDEDVNGALIDTVKLISQTKVRVPLVSQGGWPFVVRFANHADPATVADVPIQDSGCKAHSGSVPLRAFFQVTDEPITKGAAAKHLPWLTEKKWQKPTLSGKTGSVPTNQQSPLNDVLGVANFIHSD